MSEAATAPNHEAEKVGEQFRNFKDSIHQERVRNLYLAKNSKQTVAYASDMKEKYGKFNRHKMTVWEAFQFLDQVVDESDPDTSLTQMYHGFQTAEACRRKRPDDEWFHFTGFVHDLGKILATKEFGALEQWEMVGDTFPVGCKFQPANVFDELFATNPDYTNEKYSTELGIYQKGCGLDNLLMAWGHDEYMHMVLRNHKDCSLPEEAYYLVRFHSFYSHHRDEAYTHFMSEKDIKLLPLLREFQRCDLYSKTEDESCDSKMRPIDELKQYYKGLVEKFCPGIAW
jgi:inositol oxygenase